MIIRSKPGNRGLNCLNSTVWGEVSSDQVYVSLMVLVNKFTKKGDMGDVIQIFFPSRSKPSPTMNTLSRANSPPTIVFKEESSM